MLQVQLPPPLTRSGPAQHDAAINAICVRAVETLCVLTQVAVITAVLCHYISIFAIIIVI